MPVDLLGCCCGLVVWVVGTAAAAVAARRFHAARPGQPVAAPVVFTLVGAVVMLVAGVAVGLLYEALSGR